MIFLLHLLILLEIYLLLAVSLNLLVGYAGLLQVAIGAYIGVGAYTASLLVLRLHFGFLPSLLLAGLTSGLLSLLVSVPAFRFRGNAFVIVSLAVQVILYTAMYNWISLTDGPLGLTGIPKPAIMGYIFATPRDIFLLYTAITVLVIGFLIGFTKSAIGLNLQAVRDDIVAARSIGLPANMLLLQVFLISCLCAGVSGAMLSFYIGYVHPSSFSLDQSILLLSMVIIGGSGNTIGPIIGAVTLVAIPEILQWSHVPGPLAANLRLLAYGLLLISMMLWRPQGIAGRYQFE